MVKNQENAKPKILITLLGLVVAVYLGFLVGAVWQKGNSLAVFNQNFQSFIIEQHHFVVGMSEFTLKAVVIFSLIWLLFCLCSFTKMKHPYAGQEYGNAKWGNAKEFSKIYANNDKKNEVEINTGDVTLTKPLYVNTKNYWIAKDVYVNIENKKTSNLNMLIVGPPGSGKSFRLARPILSNLCGSFVVTDPKGELYKETAQYLKDNGYEPMVLNIESEFSMPMSIRFNPFRYIRTESDVLTLASILMKSTGNNTSSGGNDFFEKAAETMMISLLYLMRYYYPENERNWKTFVNLLNATTVFQKENGAIDNREDGILDIENRANEKWYREGHEGDFPGYNDIEKYYNGAAETTSSIVASLDTHCRYMKLKCVEELLSEDEIDITNNFGYMKKNRKSLTGKRALFIVTSENDRYYDWITSMIYSLMFSELYHITNTDVSFQGTLPNHLTFLMDEFANVTLPDSFVEKLSTMRSKNMSAIIILQNLIQLKRKFPNHDMDKDLIGNCSIIQILGAPDMDSCEYLSKHFGNQTIRKQTFGETKGQSGSNSTNEDVIQKPLLSPEDIFAMKPDGECAIVVKGATPLFQQKCEMEKTPFVKLLCRKDNPYVPPERKEVDEESGELEILSGKEAEEKAKELRAAGVKVITLTDDDFDVLSLFDLEEQVLEEKHYEDLGEVFSQMREQVSEYEEKTLKEAINFDDYPNKELLVVQKLLNKGFIPQQIHAMDNLIHEEMSLEELLDLFNSEMTIKGIEDFVKKLK